MSLAMLSVRRGGGAASLPTGFVAFETTLSALQALLTADPEQGGLQDSAGAIAALLERFDVDGTGANDRIIVKDIRWGNLASAGLDVGTSGADIKVYDGTTYSLASAGLTITADDATNNGAALWLPMCGTFDDHGFTIVVHDVTIDVTTRPTSGEQFVGVGLSVETPSASNITNTWTCYLDNSSSRGCGFGLASGTDVDPASFTFTGSYSGAPANPNTVSMLFGLHAYGNGLCTALRGIILPQGVSDNLGNLNLTGFAGAYSNTFTQGDRSPFFMVRPGTDGVISATLTRTQIIARFA